MTGPTSGAIAEVRDISTDEDVAADVMPSGSVTIESTTFVKWKALTALEPGHAYLVVFTFSDATNTLTGVAEVRCPI